MLRFWKHYSIHPSDLPGATLSLSVHGMLIAAWVVLTLPSADTGLSGDSLSNHVVFLPPPDRASRVATQEALRYADDGSPGEGAGFGSAAARDFLRRRPPSA